MLHVDDMELGAIYRCTGTRGAYDVIVLSVGEKSSAGNRNVKLCIHIVSGHDDFTRIHNGRSAVIESQISCCECSAYERLC